MRQLMIARTSLWISLLIMQTGQLSQSRQSSEVLYENEYFKVYALKGFPADALPFDDAHSGLLIFRRDADTSNFPKSFGDPMSFGRGTQKGYWFSSGAAATIHGETYPLQGLYIESKTKDRIDSSLFSRKWPDDFKQSITDDLVPIASIGDRAAARVSPSNQEQEQARAAYSDLLFKSDWYSKVAPSAASPDPFVDVTARTVKQSGIVVQNCSVWYVPVAWEDDKEHWKRFDRFSSPTSQRILVGKYTMWVSRSSADGPRVPVSPGDDLKPAKNVDLQAP